MSTFRSLTNRLTAHSLPARDPFVPYSLSLVYISSPLTGGELCHLIGLRNVDLVPIGLETMDIYLSTGPQ